MLMCRQERRYIYSICRRPGRFEQV